MAASPVPTVVRVDDLDGAVAAVPAILGFQPTDSLVAVALTGRRHRMEFAMRLDLPPAGQQDAFAQTVAVRLERAGAVKALLFVYTDDRPVDGTLPHHDLVDAVVAALPMDVKDAVLVAPDRLWSYLCAEPRCCPPGGRPRRPDSPAALAVEAAHVLNGDAVLPSRDAVVAGVAAIGGVRAVSLRQAIDRAAEDYLDVGADAFRAAAFGRAEQLRESLRDPRAELPDDDAATLAVALHDVEFRDAMVQWSLSDPDVMRRLLGEVARRAQPPLDAPACTALAWVAYASGDGLVAAIALERALGSDPTYSAARLLDDALM